MNGKYRITSDFIEIEGDTYKTYGIEYETENKVICGIKDITLNYSDIKSLCNLLNRNNVSIVHFFDIIEDFMVK